MQHETHKTSLTTNIIPLKPNPEIKQLQIPGLKLWKVYRQLYYALEVNNQI